MSRILLFLVVLTTSTIQSQTKEETKIKATIDPFFEGFHKGDTLLMKSIMIEKASL